MFLHRDINKNYGYKVILVGGRVAKHNGRETEGLGLTSGMAGRGRVNDTVAKGLRGLVTN